MNGSISPHLPHQTQSDFNFFRASLKFEPSAAADAVATPMYTQEDFQELFDRTIENDLIQPDPRTPELDQNEPPLYNPFACSHTPLLRFEYMIQQWLDHPPSHPRTSRSIWLAAATAYVKRMKSPFVPYVVSVLLRPLSFTKQSLSPDIFNRMDTFVEIIQLFQENPYYKKLLQYPIRLDLLKSLQQRFPHTSFWNLLDPLLVEGNVYY
jgi:hypothetical protein